MKKLSGVKGKLRIGAIVGLCTSLLCGITAGAVALPANAMNSGAADTIGGDLYSSADGRFDKTAVEALLEKTTGKQDYNSALIYLNSKSAVTSAEINALNGGKDLLLTLDGKKWTVTYLSKTYGGELIATLCYADTEENSLFAANSDGSAGWGSDTADGGYDGYKYSNHYGGSYIRAVTLGNGGVFYSSDSGEVSDGSVSNVIATEEQVQKSAFYAYAQGGISNYLVAPNEVSWQQAQKSGVSPNRLQNETLTALPPTDGWSSTYVGNSVKNDPLYNQWGNDKVWLPSLAETGVGASDTGIWETSAEQRKSAASGGMSWLRSGSGSVAHNVYGLSTSDSQQTSGTGVSYGVRPAIHLNLSKIAANYGDGSYDNAALETAWNSAVQQSLDNGVRQTFTLTQSWYADPDDTYTTSFGDDGGVGFDKGRLYVPSGASVRLDLNGYSIDRNLSAKLAEGNVITVDGGTLEICDSTGRQTGRITGAYSDGNGGGFTVVNGGSLTLTSGIISGNRSDRGAGVRVYGGAFTMNGGIITDNAVSVYGGGIWALDGSVEINGGHINGNRADSDGGGVFVNNCNLTVNGGAFSDNYARIRGGGLLIMGEKGTAEINDALISDNTAAGGGGGIALITNSGATEKTVLTFNGGKIINNYTQGNGGGVYANLGVFVMNGGEVTGNKADSAAGGLYFTNFTESTVNGGIISGNAGTYGGGINSNFGSSLTITGGTVSKNTSPQSGGGIYIGGEGGSMNFFTMTGGTVCGNLTETYGGGIAGILVEMNISGGKITDNTAKQYGGGIYAAKDNTLIISGVEISGNTAERGGGVAVNTDGKFEMNGGSIQNNQSNYGGGVLINNNAKMTVNGGCIIKNTAALWGGAVVSITGHTPEFTVNDGLISENSAKYGGALSLGAETVFELNGGKITKNTAESYGAVYYGGTIKLSGGIIADNVATQYGAPSNVYVSNNKIIVTGALAGDGKVTNIGVAMATNGAFTAGYSSFNAAYHPATFFFADNSNYGVTLTNGEAVIGAKNSQTSLLWQYSADNGANWNNIDAPYASVTYTGASYLVRALNGSGTVAFTSAPSGAVQNAGKYAYLINNTNNAYINPSLTFEVLPLELIWQYSSDGGATWADVTENTVNYTGLTYLFRAYDGTNAVNLSKNAGAVRNAGEYEFVAENAAGNYSYEEFTFKINVLRLTVEWNYTGALTDSRGNYYWDYDGQAHAPVAVLKGVTNEQAGNLPLGYAFALRGVSAGIDPTRIVGAGNYSVTVELLDAGGNALNDQNVTLSGATAAFSIMPKTVSLNWFDENGSGVTEVEYDYNGTGREVKATLSGLLPQDGVTPDISYVKVGGTLSGLPTDKGVYTAKATLPANCYNYVLDNEYTCQIDIKSVEISVEWTGNAGNGGKFEWSYYGDSANRLPLPAFHNPVANADVAYAMEYAPVDVNGSVGTYGAAAPVDAGKYMARVKITDPAGNYTLAGDTQAFEITRLGVTVVWKDSGNVSGIAPSPDADGFIKWEYDGNAHGIVPVIEGVQVFKDGVLGVNLAVTRSDSYGALTNVGSYTATAVLDGSDPFNSNFEITGNATQIYRVYKKVIASATWTDKDGAVFATGDSPRYDHGKITGASGPAFTVTAEGIGVTLTLQSPTYSATYSAEWPVDETNGYKATAKLSSADYLNYEFADGTDETYVIFFIRSISGQKENISVTWAVFTGANAYVPLSAYGDFTYNGTQQFPRALYVKNDGAYEELAISDNGKGTDAGDYTVRLLPSSKYNFAQSDFTCRYTIKPVDITVAWQDSATSGAQTFTYNYNGNEQKPHAVVSGNGSLACPVTVEGRTDAGTYIAEATVSKNFNITGGATQSYTIKKLQINANLIQWDYAADNALSNSSGGKYWIYDNAVHGPEAYIVLSQLSDLRLEFVVTGKSSAIGVHSVYAVLDSANPVHKNFDISGTAVSSFEIVRVPVNTVYWEDGAGNTSVNGGTLLKFVYNGQPQAPTAYYIDADGTTRVPLGVAGAMKDAGKYVAYVTDNFDYGGAIPQCNFQITAVEATVVWSDVLKTYNGLVQYPTATLQDGGGNAFTGVDGNALVYGTDYEITGYSEAGTYTAEIRFINANYTFAGSTGRTKFTVERADISNLVSARDWSADSAASTNADGLYSWTYNAQKHAPALSLAAYRLDGDLVTVTFGYSGVTETVGTHTVTAYIASAMWRGKDISANLGFTASVGYEITAFEITLSWDFAGQGATQDAAGGAWYWIYDKNSHAPAVTYADWTGAKKSLSVYGAETNARDTAYTARVDAPANCVFASGETGTRTFEIRRATIEVDWRAPDAAGIDTDGNFYWNYDGQPHAPKAYIRGTQDTLSVTGAATDAGENYTATAAQGDSNYVILSGATCTFGIKPLEVYLKWYGKNGSTQDFTWQYDGDNHAPTAVLADASGNVLNGTDGSPIAVSVTGATANVGANHTAHAVDTFPNYNFHSGARLDQAFAISARSLSDFGFAWQAQGAAKTNDGKYDVYTYEYSGGVIAPKPYTQNNLSFDMTIRLYTGGAAGAQIQAITETGDYIITIRPVNGNYAVPAGMDTVRVTVKPRTVAVVWGTAALVYNGGPQAPAAHYIDAEGNTVTLGVSGAMTNAGKDYTATAAFIGTAPANYVLDTNTVTEKFDVAQREIPVEWQWSGEWRNKRVTYDTQAHTPVPRLDTTAVLSADVTKLTFAYEITKTGMAAIVNGTVSEAGEYTVSLKLNGTAAANYKFESGKERETFTIAKAALNVTADDFTVNYGDPAPAYTATFSGWVGTDSETSLGLSAVQSSWLRCSYINRSTPGTYTIGLVYAELSRLLPNYDVITHDGTLTVNPAAGTVIWSGDLPDVGAYYDGAAYKPFAFYYDINDTAAQNPITLSVVYATYYGGVYTEITNPDYAAVNAGTYYVIAKSPNSNVALSNAEISFEIYKREITVEIESKASVYGNPYKTLTYKYAQNSLKPLDSDDLNITLSCDVFDSSLYVNGYMNAGVYDIAGSWDGATYGANYNVVFAGENDALGVYEVIKAEIKVTKASEHYSDEEFTSIQELDTQSLGVQIKLGDTYTDENGVNQYRYIQYNGYRNAAGVTVYYSRVHNIGRIETGLLTPPDPHDGVTDGNVVIGGGINAYQTYRERIRNVGCYAINYIIEIPNHETLYGTWTVLMLPESQVVRVSFEKDYETEYGKPVPENLAEELLNGGYISINNIVPERFLQYATASVSDGRGGLVGATTNVGKYTVEIQIANTDSNTQLLVTYHSDFGDEDTNVDRYVINPKKLTIDWGELEFDHDGTLKMPSPNVYGWVTADTLVLENIKTKPSGAGYEYTSFTVVDNGAAVTLVVAARGNFADVGGHTLLVTVENGNYSVGLLNANATVSIKGETVIEENGLPDWLLWVIIGAAILVAVLILIIIIVIKKKRAALKDDDGFYDNVEQ